MIKLASLLGVAVALGVGPVLAQQALVLEGKCQELVLADNSLTEACSGTVMLAAFPSQTGMVNVILSTGSAFNFYLDQRPGEGTVPVVEVEINLHPIEDRIESVGARGSCELGDLGTMPVSISCTAKDPDGFSYRLRFVGEEIRVLDVPN